MNYVDEEQMDVMAFEMGQTRLRGSRFADKVEDVGRNIVGGLQAASQDQEGIGDDILRAGGKVLQGVGAVANLPGIKQGLQVLDAPFHYGSKLAGAAAERMGIDPRLGEWTVRGAELATGLGAAKKAPQLAKKGVKAADNLAYQASARILNEMAPNYLKQGAGSLPVPDELMKIYKADEAAALKAGPNYTSTKATVTSELGGRQVYDKFAGKKDVKLKVPKELGGPLESLTRIEGVPSKQFHHIFLKDIAAEYVEKMRKIGTPDDVIELDKITKKHGFGLGNYEDAGLYADKIPHDLGHEWAIKSGRQPRGDQLKALKSDIQKQSNVRKLTKDFEETVKELAVPLKEEIEDLQWAWDAIDPKDRMELFKRRWKRDALRKETGTKAAGVNKDLDKATKAYKELKKRLTDEASETRTRRSQVKENISDRRMDELQKAAELSQ